MTRRLPSSVRPAPPGPDQESVWDYPRPPALMPSTRRITVRFGSLLIADSTAAWRVLETSHPPNWYIPAADIDFAHLRASAARSTLCEWKGAATYWDVIGTDGEIVDAAGWSYPSPTPRFVPITGFLSFMPGRLECAVDGERVVPQAGGFYGGWITRDVVGPFKGEPGTWGW
jgi:uncharacterized protein (DUF427 family)